MYYKRKIGISGEDAAVNYLETHGLKIIERNFNCRQGEIDIIAKDKKEIVFIEVKTRRSRKYGDASEAVDRNKQKHLLNAIKFYIYLKKLQNSFIRIDVIEVYLHKNNVRINHIKKAIV